MNLTGIQFVIFSSEPLRLHRTDSHAGVNAVATTLKKAGLIHYSRGTLTVLDRDRLERLTCECYKTLKTVHERLFTSPV